jgi:hypothetical protein
MLTLWVTPQELDSTVAASSFAHEACQVATSILWALSGRQYSGTKTVTESYEFPCGALGAVPARYLSQPGLFNVQPYLLADSSIVNGVCGCPGTVGGRHVRLRLRGRPVISVQEVTRGGVVVDSDTYTVVNRSMLQGAAGGFLDMQGLTVTYTYGAKVPTAGRMAAAQLAGEFIKSWDPSQDECRLPDRVTSVNRQGVSYTILDDQAYLDDLRTGIYAIDLFLKSVNPDRARKPARVFSPDLPRAIRVTGTSVQQPVGPDDIVLDATGDTEWTRTLYGIDGGIFLTSDWQPVGQITSSQGAPIVELNEARFTISPEDGTISFTLTSDESEQLTDVGVFDLFAVGGLDSSLLHVMTSSVRPASTVA